MYSLLVLMGVDFVGAVLVMDVVGDDDGSGIENERDVGLVTSVGSGVCEFADVEEDGRSGGVG